MNIPPEVARAQAHHGSKGATHGAKGGRPRLQLTEEERKEHRRQQQEAYRRRKGIGPREVLTWEERRERDQIAHAKYWDQEYRKIWGKLPDDPLTPDEFSKHYPAFRKWVRDCQARNYPLDWPVRFVREHQRHERRLRLDAAEAPQLLTQHQARSPRTQQARTPHRATPSVGRNEPCPCGSGRKFKKCCGKI